MPVSQEAFRYTSLCRFFAAGNCDRGEDCHFAHNESQLREKPDLSRTRMCRSYAKTGECKEGPSCRYAHSEGEVRSQDGGSSGAPDEAAAEQLEGRWSRCDSSWSMHTMEDSNDSEMRQPCDNMGSSFMPWMAPGNMAFCPMPMWSPNGYGGYHQVMAWMPSGDMTWMGCQWQEMSGQTVGSPTNMGSQSPAKAASKKLAWDPISEEPSSSPCSTVSVLPWDPIGQEPNASAGLASSLDWDPLGLGPSATPAEDSGTSAAVIDPNVVLLAARGLDKKAPTTADYVKRASFYSLPSTTISETDTDALYDDEADDVFEAWARCRTEGDSPNDTIMHKGVHYEMTIRNTFISFGVSDTAKRMLIRSHSEPSLDRDD